MFYNKNKDESFSEYQDFLVDEKITLARMLCILSFVLYGSFTVVDYFALPSAFESTIAIRTSVMFVLFVCYLLTYTSKYIQYYSLLHAFKFSSAILGVLTMVYLATPEDQAYNTYYAGLIIVIIALFSWSHWKLRYSLSLAVATLLGYLYIEINIRNFIGNDSYPRIITNMFFFSSAIIFGFFSQFLRDKHLKRNFILQQSLKVALDKKSIEARDNEYLANHDPLTDLPNRRYMMELLNESLRIAREKDKILVVMFVDLNGFKQINDVYGHNAGDEVLLIVAKRLELAIRKGDHLSRLGGDEYLLGLMMEKENLSEIESLANKFVGVISQSMNVEGLRIKVGASIGVAAYPIHGNNIESLISISDHRMYQVKKGKTDSSAFDNDSIKTDEELENESVVIFPGNKKY